MTEKKKAPARKPRVAAATKTTAEESKQSRRSTLEIKVGVQYSPREITIEVEQDANEIETALNEATSNGATLMLTDVKGRRVLLPADKITYIEIGEPVKGRVGFGAR
jgi:hypothetical protein